MRKFGFTVAEVLIAMSIIGIIAVLTVPAFLKDTKEEEYRTALKKAITQVNHALTVHYAIEGISANSYRTSDDLVNNVFKKRISCIDTNKLTEFTSEICKGGAFFMSEDGIIFCINNFSSTNSNYCNSYNTTPCIQEDAANLWIDVNGVKKPNKVTESMESLQDIYQAQIYAQKVLPYGLPTQQLLFGKEYVFKGNDIPSQPDDKEDDNNTGNNNGNQGNNGNGNGNGNNGEGNNGNQGEGNNGNGNNNDNDNDFSWDPNEYPNFQDWLDAMRQRLGELFEDFLRNLFG